LILHASSLVIAQHSDPTKPAPECKTILGLAVARADVETATATTKTSADHLH